MMSIETVAEQKHITRVILADELSLQGWADRLSNKWRNTVEAVVEMGRDLIKAKAAVAPGDFAKIFKPRNGEPAAVARPLKISQHTGEALMRIARHPVLSNSTHWVDLPSSYKTLYELTHLSAPVLEAHLATGVVHAELTRAAATALLPALDWRAEWQGMPEYVSNDLSHWKTLNVHFECQEDLQRFARLIKQSLTTDTKYVWYPQQVRKRKEKCWVDEGSPSSRSAHKTLTGAVRRKTDLHNSSRINDPPRVRGLL